MLKLVLSAGLKQHLEVLKLKWNFGNNKLFADKCEELLNLKFNNYDELYTAINKRDLSYNEMIGFNGFNIVEVKK